MSTEDEEQWYSCDIAAAGTGLCLRHAFEIPLPIRECRFSHRGLWDSWNCCVEELEIVESQRESLGMSARGRRQQRRYVQSAVVPPHRKRMKRIALCAVLFVSVVARASAQSATFRVDGLTKSPSVAVASIEPRPGAPGYSWLRIYFYTSLTPNERKEVETGGPRARRTNWSAVFQLGLDKALTVWQVDMAVPGHTCTVAASDVEAKTAIQAFQFDGHQVSLRAKGSHECDMSGLHIPNSQFEWDVDVVAQVIESPHR